MDIKIKAANIGKLAPIRLNIMVVGETRSGKTTFLRTMFNNYCEDEVIKCGSSGTADKTVVIEQIGAFQIKSEATACNVHLLDSPGYGDCIDNSNAIKIVKEYLLNAHKTWLNSNSNLKPEQDRTALDHRVHSLFYFIAPHRIKNIDKEFIKTLNGLAPMVLVVAKADTMTLQEREVHLRDVQRMVTKLSGLCQHPICFDFHEQGDGFLEAETEVTEVPAARAVSSTRESASEGELGEAEVTGEHDLSSCIVVEEGLPLPPQGGLAANPAGAVAMPTMEPAQMAVSSVVNSGRVTSRTSVLPRVRNIFAVVCDTSPSGRREYPWGALDIYDETHSDFRRLQRVVLDSGNVCEFIRQTQDMSLQLHAAGTIALLPAASGAASDASNVVNSGGSERREDGTATEQLQVGHHSEDGGGQRKERRWVRVLREVDGQLHAAKKVVDGVIVTTLYGLVFAYFVLFIFGFVSP